MVWISLEDIVCWWVHQDSNLGPAGYEPVALTAELWARRVCRGGRDGRPATLGRAGQEYWQREHSLERMVEDYERVMRRACEVRESEEVQAQETGKGKLKALLEPFGVTSPW